MPTSWKIWEEDVNKHVTNTQYFVTERKISRCTYEDGVMMCVSGTGKEIDRGD